MKKQFNLENKLIGYANTLTRICNLHNDIDETLNKIIDDQNNATRVLDEIHKELLMSKGLEKDAYIESIEEIYEKAKNTNSNKKEIANRIEMFIEKVQLVPFMEKNSLDEYLSTIQYIEANIVIFI